MVDRISVGELQVAEVLHRFVEQEALPGSGVDSAAFWTGVASILRELGPRNQALLARREELQAQIDAFHRDSPGRPEPVAYAAFLRSIGYLVEEPDRFEVTTSGVDPEVATIAGPQLVVPLLNARFATNAANARWGSLYDALYGTDVIADEGELARRSNYNPTRGAEVIARGRSILDEHLPLQGGSHADATAYSVDAQGLVVATGAQTLRLADPAQLVGFRGSADSPEAVVLVHHGLHLELVIDPRDPIGSLDRAGVKDIVLESAVSTIMDLEDSVAAVDAADKVVGYRNWLHLMRGTLAEKVTKGGHTFVRAMNPDRSCRTFAGEEVVLPGRSLLFIRQVGHLMTTAAILDADGVEVPEGILDALVTTLGSLPELRGGASPTTLRNSRNGAMYVVKPKMHGPEEVAFTCDLMERVESLLGLPRLTVKLGIMDEERRTSINLKACLHAARERVAFINTGFLDRTGDEIHTSTHAGPVVRKADMRAAEWIGAYEASNVDVGLACGLQGRAQIGKGMWAAPDNLAEMLLKKRDHPAAGASCAWVPSPTAATLHAIHYHEVDVWARQRELADRTPVAREQLLAIPLAEDTSAWTAEDRQAELDNNVQSTLGYVVRWVDAGIGCSKVPDLAGSALMEDRATCRISAQHVANWVRHGVITTDDVEQSLRRMAAVVDAQNAVESDYVPMAPNFTGEAFLAARELLLDGISQPSGYTEPILHRRRIARKAQTSGTT
ncbi:Malate synthase G [metagenome]|uniref:Malate synthase G n=1 Tax=metagenome TaxID=256318 RepID=A0A2P2C905_9ZZZZ